MAISVHRGVAPAGLVDALAARVRAAETALTWESTDPDGWQEDARGWSWRVTFARFIDVTMLMDSTKRGNRDGASRS